jgi:hypothetical protein
MVTGFSKRISFLLSPLGRAQSREAVEAVVGVVFDLRNVYGNEMVIRRSQGSWIIPDVQRILVNIGGVPEIDRKRNAMDPNPVAILMMPTNCIDLATAPRQFACEQNQH